MQDGALGGIAAVGLFAISIAMAVFAGKRKEAPAVPRSTSTFGIPFLPYNYGSQYNDAASTSVYDALIASIEAAAVSSVVLV